LLNTRNLSEGAPIVTGDVSKIERSLQHDPYLFNMEINYSWPKRHRASLSIKEAAVKKATASPGAEFCRLLYTYKKKATDRFQSIRQRSFRRQTI